jgi:alpha-galactosidase
MRTQAAIGIVVGLIGPAGLQAVDWSDIPASAPQDEVMASRAELETMWNWVGDVFVGERLPGRQPAVRVQVRRQDHSVLQFGRSCIGTPLRLGPRQFEHGLGTHAYSELVLQLPPGAKVFRAIVGVDNNPDTGGTRGSVQFVVEAEGRELFRSPVRRASDAPLPVEVKLPAGLDSLVLKVEPTADGVSHDQADWAEAAIELADGRRVWVDTDPPPFLECTVPFSFRYGGRSSAELLSAWDRDTQMRETRSHFLHTVHWTDPETGLRLTATIKVFKHYPAAEWVLEFHNTSTTNSPMLEQVQALDAWLRSGYFRTPVRLHRLTGDLCSEQSFLPTETVLELDKPVSFAPVGGRPSNHAFPFFNVQYEQEGVLVGIGWSGQWAAGLRRAVNGPTRLWAGMEQMRLSLLPGERIRTPRVLVMPWHGDRLTAHARFRRLLLFEYVPRHKGKPVALPVALQCFDRYSWTRPDWATETGQLHAVQAAANLGFDTHWLDAAWFVGGFPNGVGNWVCKPTEFPSGLQPISEACHARGMKFMVWFEPERVAAGTQLAREHPEFVLGGTNGGLFKLHDPAAREWLAELLSARIREFGLDVYRNDFNIDPLPFWRQADPPDRQGITEIRYVEGQYALWDELRSRHNGLLIDNCASGGRRIDLETLSRAVPLWRSDTSCAPGHADWDQTQTLGLGLCVPLFAACAWEPKAYVTRSAATAGFIAQFDYLNPDFPADEARAAVAEAKANAKYWYGDFYPLTPATTSSATWAAWQLHRPDLDAGLVLAFRRSQCPYPALQVSLRGVRPQTRYRLQLVDEQRKCTERLVTGQELASDFELRLERKGTSLLMRYAAESEQR